MEIKDIPLNSDHEPLCGSASEAGHIPMGCTYDKNGRVLSYKDSTGFWRERTRDSHGRELGYKDSTGFWYECTYDSKGRVLSCKTNDFNGFRIADDGNYVLHYDNTNETFLAGCSGVLTREQAIKRWDRDDDRAKLYTLAISVTRC